MLYNFCNVTDQYIYIYIYNFCNVVVMILFMLHNFCNFDSILCFIVFVKQCIKIENCTLLLSLCKSKKHHW